MPAAHLVKVLLRRGDELVLSRRRPRYSGTIEAVRGSAFGIDRAARSFDRESAFKLTLVHACRAGDRMDFSCRGT